jgi:hypothetical protein
VTRAGHGGAGRLHLRRPGPGGGAGAEGEGSLGRLLSDPTMAAGLEGTLAELQVLLQDIRENPRRYLRLSIF